jgi:glycine/D-amino acid oxidase-like deaminating enzyme
MRVTVFEAGHVGCGTSSATFGYTNANHKPPREYQDLNVAGMRAHVALRDELGATPWLHDTGNIEWFFEEKRREAQRKKIETLHAWGYPVEWLTLAELRALEPDIDPSAVGDSPIAFFPEEGWVDPVPYAHAMIEGARRYGATVHIGTRVSLATIDRAVAGVRTSDGTMVGADVVVNCGGRFLNDIGDHQRLRIPLAPTHGILVLSPPVPTRLQRVIHAPQANVHPDGAGRLMIYCRDVDELTTIDSPPGEVLDAAHLGVRNAARILPSLAGAKAEVARLGIRSMPKDGYPVVGQIPNVRGYYVVVTHSAVTLSPILGVMVADEIARGRPDARLAPYRPDRFQSPST